MLSAYPEDIAIEVTDPRAGIASRSKFLPTLSEVRDACEKAMQPRYDAAAREAERKRLEAQLEERRQWQESQASTDGERISRVAAEFVKEMSEKHGALLRDEEADKLRQREREHFAALNAVHRFSTLETPSGIRISPALREYLDAPRPASDPSARHLA